MNTLIKFIITTVLGLVGTFTQIEDSQVYIHAQTCPVIHVNGYEIGSINNCRFQEKGYIMLKWDLGC